MGNLSPDGGSMQVEQSTIAEPTAGNGRHQNLVEDSADASNRRNRLFELGLQNVWVVFLFS